MGGKQLVLKKVCLKESDLEIVREISAKCARRRSIDDFELQFIITELLANVIVHGNGEAFLRIGKVGNNILVCSIKNLTFLKELPENMRHDLPLGKIISVDFRQFDKPEGEPNGKGMIAVACLCDDNRIDLQQRLHSTPEGLFVEIILKHPIAN